MQARDTVSHFWSAVARCAETSLDASGVCGRGPRRCGGGCPSPVPVPWQGGNAPAFPFVCLSVCLPVCLSVFLSVCVHPQSPAAWRLCAPVCRHTAVWVTVTVLDFGAPACGCRFARCETLFVILPEACCVPRLSATGRLPPAHTSIAACAVAPPSLHVAVFVSLNASAFACTCWPRCPQTGSGATCWTRTVRGGFQSTMKLPGHPRHRRQARRYHSAYTPTNWCSYCVTTRRRSGGG